jgi:hypothetical protein
MDITNIGNDKIKMHIIANNTSNSLFNDITNSCKLIKFVVDDEGNPYMYLQGLREVYMEVSSLAILL